MKRLSLLVAALIAAVAAFRLSPGKRSLTLSVPVLGLAAFGLLAAASASSAIAAPIPGYGPVGTFGNAGELPTEGAVFSLEGGGPKGIAVDDATGNILVTDSNGETIPPRVAVFAPAAGPGVSPTFLTQIPISGLPWGIAVDQATGAVYVSDYGANRIIRFISDGAPVPTYTEDPTFASPELGSAGCGGGEMTCDIGSFASALAVDPSTDDLLVADSGNQRVVRFSSSGQFIDSFDGSESPGGHFSELRTVAAAPDGSTYALSMTNGSFPLSGEEQSRIVKYDASDHYSKTLASPALPRAIAMDGAGRLLVDEAEPRVNLELSPLDSLAVYQDDVFANAYRLPPGAAGSLARAMAAATPASKAYVLDDRFFFYGSPAVQESNIGPAVEAEATTIPQPNPVSLHGVVNPEGERANVGGGETSAFFEYRVQGTTDWSATSPTAAGAGETDVPVTAAVTLMPHQVYEVRLSATTSLTTMHSPVVTVTSADTAPDVTTEPPTDRTTEGAVLRGNVNPNGIQTSYHFEYGPTSGYGSRTPSYEGVVGAGRQPSAVHQALSGLAPGTIVHYRLVARNAVGETAGTDQVFVTRTTGPLARAYELVSTEPGEADVQITASGFQARDDGGAMTYTSQAAVADSASSPLFVRSRALRTPDGWVSTPIDPTINGPEENNNFFAATVAISEDQSHALVISDRKLTPDAVEENGNLYVEDLATRTYVLVATSSERIGDRGIYGLTGATSANPFMGGTPDMSTIAFSVADKLTSDASGQKSVYRWTRGGGIKNVGLHADGSPIATEISGASRGSSMSSDGSKLYYASLDGVYLRSGSTTTAISVSQVPGAPGGAFGGELVQTSPDGRYALFVTSGTEETPLTPDAPTAQKNLYRYDAVTNNLTFIGSEVSNANFVLGGSSDLTTVYFIGTVNGGPRGIYASRAGEVKFVSGEPGPGQAARASVSRNGRYVAYMTEGGDGQVHVFDLGSGITECASCRPDGKPSSGDASLGIGTADILAHHAQVVSDSGQVFFATPNSLVASDSNGTRDVYEWAGGEVSLISSGAPGETSSIQDSTSSGDDVFFVTNGRLVGQDQDSAFDLYDARVGGGFPPPEPVSVECAGRECASASGSPSSGSLGGSQSVTGSKNTTGRPSGECPKVGRKAKPGGPKVGRRCHKSKAHKRKHRAKRGKAHAASRTSGWEKGGKR